jgi:hypothetical protein
MSEAILQEIKLARQLVILIVLCCSCAPTECTQIRQFEENKGVTRESEVECEVTQQLTVPSYRDKLSSDNIDIIHAIITDIADNTSRRNQPNLTVKIQPSW